MSRFSLGYRVGGWVALGVAAGWLLRERTRRARRMDFRGKTVLITGGSRGLGLLLARRFAAQGARVAICARDGDEVERAVHDLLRWGAEGMGLVCDVTDRLQVERTVQAVAARWGEVSVLINNAGVIQVGPERDMTVADYEQAMRVHFWGPLYATLAVLPAMRQRRSGRIVNIASFGGKVSVPHLLPYSASKFALVGMSEGLRAELLGAGILVTTVCPGVMRTGSFRRAGFKGHYEQEYAWFRVNASVPVCSMSAERAADQIIDACRHGAPEVVLSLPAKALALLHGIAPGAVTDALSLVNRLLPLANGGDEALHEGRDIREPRLPGWVTGLGDRAAQRNNEIP